MKVFTTWEEIENIAPTVLALGNFDGVHAGHQTLIAHAVKNAEAAKLKSAVFTFSNHPKDDQVKNILVAGEKTRIMAELGVAYLFNMPFDASIMGLAAEAFIHEKLLAKLNMREVWCGFNYKFGHQAAGNPELLVREGIQSGFEVHVLPPVIIDGEVVSSSLIRRRIEAGDMEACRRLLGRHYAIDGTVVVGNKIGRTIGFPTSNLIIDASMASPANGVYITHSLYGGARFPSITNVGVKPTIGQFQKNVETHIFDFEKELYGEKMRIEFLKKMRDECKFDDVDALKKQIAKDCALAKAFHGKNFT